MTKQAGVLALLDVQPGDRVLEIGYGPGAMIRMLASRTQASAICGVDPSKEMLGAASRKSRAEIAAGRVELRLGTAAETGLPEASFDRIVSVNNVALWPDLDAGLRELRRVLRPGGRVVLAWHGGQARSRLARNLRLSAGKLELLKRTLVELFADVEQLDLEVSVVFRARR